jgi:hypothetical protein
MEMEMKFLILKWMSAFKTTNREIMVGKNDQFRNVFWIIFITLAGFVLAQIVDPETARGIMEMLLHG